MFSEILSKSNSKIKHVKKLVNLSKYRKESGQFTIEGIKLVREAIDSGMEILQCFFVKEDEEVKKIFSFSGESFKISETLMKFITDTKTPQGVLCVLQATKPERNILPSSGKFLILENVKDPGNIGTIIRSASAFSLDALILTKNCCDIYSPKVLRSTMGSIFKTRILFCNNLLNFIDEIKAKGFKILASEVRKENTENIKSLKKDNIAIIIGNESKGVSKDALRISDKKVHIPISETTESLNVSVAASIFMWEMFKNDER